MTSETECQMNSSFRFLQVFGHSDKISDQNVSLAGPSYSLHMAQQGLDPGFLADAMTLLFSATRSSSLERKQQ